MSEELVLDLHLHSRFSQAVSKSMTLENLYVWGAMKGSQVLSVSDVTHPVWFAEIEAQLTEQRQGVYTLKEKKKIEEMYPKYFQLPERSPIFMLTTELSLIYSEFGKGRRVHVIVCFPNLEVVRKVNKIFLSNGFNLASDGRPILGISLRNLCTLLFEIDSEIAVIPAHAWTPWFGVYGSKSGYDSLEEAFGDFAPQIFAIESGLSSDPLMNWQIKELDTRNIVSFSDAHSLPKIGREATVLKGKSGQIREYDISYENIINGLKKGGNSPFMLAYTIEYYPEEGKYHHTGHRNCGVSFTPEQTHKSGIVCPVCGRNLTVGVLHRIERLKTEKPVAISTDIDENGVAWQENTKKGKFVNLVPLLEIISESLGVGVTAKKVNTVYTQLIESLGTEHAILLEVPIIAISRVAGEKIAQAVQKVRSRDISIQPGFDGEYGKVTIWEKKSSAQNEQLKMI